MLDSLLQVIAPHHCCSCDKVGLLLCSNCKYDIISEPFLACVACGQNTAGRRGICESCKVAYSRGWCVGDRTDALRTLIDRYKFSNARAAHKPLASLLHEALPELPEETIIIPIPTISSHIRQRGYDHMLLVAKELARTRQLPLSQGLQRRSSSRQKHADAKTRRRQAKEAFEWKGAIRPAVTYLLVDDVVTTGSTLHFAAQALCNAGAMNVWAVTISRQPLD